MKHNFFTSVAPNVPDISRPTEREVSKESTVNVQSPLLSKEESEDEEDIIVKKVRKRHEKITLYLWSIGSC